METDLIKEHWLLRMTPRHHRDRVARFGLIFGCICSMIWTLGAFAGLFLAPLAFAIQWPDAPLSQPILWLIRIAGPDASVPVYSLTMLVLILIVYTGHTLFDYLTKHPRRRGG